MIEKGHVWVKNWNTKNKIGVKTGPATTIYVVDDKSQLNELVNELGWNKTEKVAFLPEMKTLDELQNSRHTIYNDHYFNGKSKAKGNHKYCPYCKSHLKEDNTCPNQECSHANMAVGIPVVGDVLSKPIPKKPKSNKPSVNIQLSSNNSLFSIDKISAILDDNNPPVEEKDNDIPKLQEFSTEIEVNGGNDMDGADIQHSDPDSVDNSIDNKHIKHLHGAWEDLCGDE
jgi:hypothetical protein